MADRDPIRTLLDDLDATGAPDFAWTVAWSADSRDPVAAAWAASRDGRAMARLLGRVAPVAAAGLAAALARATVARAGALPPVFAQTLAAIERAVRRGTLLAPSPWREARLAAASDRVAATQVLWSTSRAVWFAWEAATGGRDGAMHAAGELAHVWQATGDTAGWPRVRHSVWPEVWARMADVVRAHAPAPTLADVVAATARDAS